MKLANLRFVFAFALVFTFASMVAVAPGCGDDDDDDDDREDDDADDDTESDDDFTGGDDDDDMDDDDDTSGDDDADDDDTGDDDDASDDDTGDDDTGDDDTGDDDTGDDDVSTLTCDATSITRAPYMIGVTPTSVEMLWKTNRRGDSTIEYGTTESLGDVFVEDTLVSSHHVTLDGLSPGTRFYYRVKACDDAVSDTYSFVTAPDDDSPFSFAVLGDNRSNPAMAKAVADETFTTAPDILLNVGDIVNNGWNRDEYDSQFFGPSEELLASAPVFVSIGNHEGESPYFYDVLPYPGNGTGFYSFTYGNTLFIALNTNKLYLPGTGQYNWVEGVLQSAEAQAAEWIVAFAHHPPYSEGWDNAGYNGEPLMRTSLVPLFEQYGVDVFFQGHTHDYERGTLNDVLHIISGGAGSGLDSFQQDIAHIVVYESRHHFVSVNVADKVMTLDAIDVDGVTFDQVTLTH
ncbi:metallophosphoesterase family protein [bacterium]|nr:metallophosphoesterase family protein [bacterium]